MDDGEFFDLWEPECREHGQNTEASNQAVLFRDLIGNPVRPVVVRAECSHWKDNTIIKLAGTINAEHRYSDLPILADALEDAGCDNAELLSHCRGSGPHVRGCWALDLLLGKG
jgi:hypothetical protein